MRNPTPIPVTRLRDSDPKGRVDVAAYRGAEHFAKEVGLGEVWNMGLGELVETVIEGTIPSKPVTGRDVARSLGLAGRRQR
jgi:hypothetical protein